MPTARKTPPTRKANRDAPRTSRRMEPSLCSGRYDNNSPVNITLMQAPGGKDEDRDRGFEHGGWMMPYWNDAIGDVFVAMMKDVDAFLLGRRAYVTPEGVHATLSLTSATPYPSGVVGLHYRRQ
jgi:hypothetical protein